MIGVFMQKLGQVNYTIFDSTPTSFLLTAGVDDSEYTNFVTRYRDIVKQSFSKECIPAKHCEANMWLVKPANLNQGIVFGDSFEIFYRDRKRN
jgi:hypothetical protein